MTVPVAPGAPADAPPAVPVTTPPTPPAAVPATPAPPVPTPPQSSDDLTKLRADLDAANQRAEKIQAESRKHEDRWKTRDEQLEQQSTLLKTLAEKAGIEVDGAPDPQKLLAQVSSATQIANDKSRELAIFRAANGVANADLLLDSRAFMAQTADLDPSSADFNERVKALVAQTVTANPSLAATPPAAAAPPVVPPPALPAASGADFSGAPPGSGQWTEADVEKASPEALSKAIDQGLLKSLGYSPRRHGRNR